MNETVAHCTHGLRGEINLPEYFFTGKLIVSFLIFELGLFRLVLLLVLNENII